MPRVISAPTTKLKDIQRRLADVLYLCRAEIYKNIILIQFYLMGLKKKSQLLRMLKRHRGKTLLLNIDLEDYFDSFNFGRVRGFFLSNRDFRLNNTVATTIAQIACFQNGLPQGSPCSPIISNLISGILDIRLSKLAKKYGCNYSRYADDLTFSTNKKNISKRDC
ncbi:reverse transcriptase domain-containing protein [Escherichia coli]|uniref:reverse transcriptase domain-containing protein n=1 Tax=Escherichia coli TaxID=562 RepID=UPI001FCE5E02|nr:reverse transcriptase domain-containing protein [Escherichia coli]